MACYLEGMARRRTFNWNKLPTMPPGVLVMTSARPKVTPTGVKVVLGDVGRFHGSGGMAPARPTWSASLADVLNDNQGNGGGNEQ